MNVFSFYHNGELFATCWTNEVAKNHISACADLAEKGLTPHFWPSKDGQRKVLIYSDSFAIMARTKAISAFVTPENISALPKPLQRELARFEYDGVEWKAKGATHGSTNR